MPYSGFFLNRLSASLSGFGCLAKKAINPFLAAGGKILNLFAFPFGITIPTSFLRLATLASSSFFFSILSAFLTALCTCDNSRIFNKNPALNLSLISFIVSSATFFVLAISSTTFFFQL